MRLCRFAVVALTMSVVALPCLAAAASARKRDDSAAEKLGFKLSLQCWTFRKLTFVETVDKAAGLGIKYLEMYPDQKLKPDSDVKINSNMSDEVCNEIKKKLADAGGLKVIAFGVNGVPTDEPGARKVFEWAKKMGIEVLVTETTPNEIHDKLCTEYNIKMALHNHPETWPPEKVLAACKDRCALIGSSADTGHWMRADRVPVDTLKKMEGRIVHVHFKDLDEYGKRGNDVPWGTGKGDAKGMMQELKRQGYKGYFSIEYERGNLDDLAKNLPLCVEFFDKTAAEPASAGNSTQPFAGGWDLNLPGGSAGWLGVTEKDGQLQASLLWGGGSVVPVASAKVEDGKLVLRREQREGGKKSTTTITASAVGDTLDLTIDNSSGSPVKFSGKRTPPVPPTPDLAKVKFGESVVLFNGKDLTGWKLINPKQASGWSVQDGVLVNRVVQEEGKPRKSFGNLRTEQEFNDFNLTLETRVAKGGNSGIYLRGIYEIQVMDSYGRPLDSHNMGGIYSRICPTVAAEKPAGEWQSLDITLVDRHVTVILNGTKIIDNQPLLGCTGGALWADQLRPGPIYLQGDHTGIEYRNIALRPVVK